MQIGYARVSTDGQTLDAQLEVLSAAGIEKVFREKISGARADRPQLAKLLATIQAGDVVVVTRLDRLARSTRDLLNLLAEITGKGAAFRSLADHWADTTTPHGRLMVTVLGGLAEFERELIKVRTSEGRKRAKDRGVKLGPPHQLTLFQREEITRALVEGVRGADLARRYNVSKATVSRLRPRSVLERNGEREAAL